MCVPTRAQHLHRPGQLGESQQKSSADSHTRVCAVVLLPLVLHAFYHRRLVWHLHAIGGTLGLLILSAFCANLGAFDLTASGPTAHGAQAGMAILAIAVMTVLLEQCVITARRHRPAVAAGCVWLATYATTAAFGGIAEALRCDDGGTAACTFDRVKWLLVTSFTVACIATVLSLLLSARFAPTLRRLRHPLHTPP